jgi:hypothetical protein
VTPSRISLSQVIAAIDRQDSAVELGNSSESKCVSAATTRILPVGSERRYFTHAPAGNDQTPHS